MDFGKAALLIACVLGLVELIKGTFPNLPDRLRPAICLAIGIFATFLTAHTVWAHEQVIGDKNLGQLDWPSLLFVGILLGAATAGVYWAGRKVVANVGENIDGP